jgi:hypothetical protein
MWLGSAERGVISFSFESGVIKNTTSSTFSDCFTIRWTWRVMSRRLAYRNKAGTVTFFAMRENPCTF